MEARTPRKSALVRPGVAWSPSVAWSHSVAWSLAAVLTAACAESPPIRRVGRMDPSRAFYYPDFAATPERALATLGDGSIDAAGYLRYLAGRFGTRYLEDLAFDLALARECANLELARSAPVLARSAAARRFLESGRTGASDPDGTQQRKFLNETLRRMRVDALCGARRAADPEALRALFAHRYGTGGERVQVRHLLVSFAMTRRRLERAGAAADQDAVRAAAQARATALRDQIGAAQPLTSILGQSDDRATRTVLRDPARSEEAGLLAGYDYQRFGEGFAAAVRGLEVGQVSAPVASPVGFHLVELVGREVTRLDAVAADLRIELRRGQAKPVEIMALRADLLAKYRFVAMPPAASGR